MKVIYLLFFLAYTQVSFAQKAFIFPKIKTHGETIAQATPVNWAVINQTYGDLNGDGTEDVALVLEYHKAIDETRVYGDNNTDIIKETQKPRMLAIFFKDKTNASYQLSTQNNDFILRSEEGGRLGDPLQQMHISDGQLYLRFSGGSEWRWELGYTFKFQHNDWFLTNAVNLYYNNNSGEMTERVYNFTDRELYTTYGNIYRRDIANHRTSEVLFFSQLRTFKTFKKPWAWEIMPNVYL
ncbi:hypothetical protein [Pedobacter nototheniae]|uniref:hypothetical protein n=1 Tax=Pedobacter nototheniae TaxID=2488994 RepID=UPI00292EC2F2|nr:hypothetical protein [Pedobacter nototheniae]